MRTLVQRQLVHREKEDKERKRKMMSIEEVICVRKGKGDSERESIQCHLMKAYNEADRNGLL